MKTTKFPFEIKGPLENERAFMRFESMKQRKMCIMHSFTPSFDVRVSKSDQVIVCNNLYFPVFKDLHKFYLNMLCTLFMFLKLAPAERKPIKSKVVMYMHQQKTAT